VLPKNKLRERENLMAKAAVKTQVETPKIQVVLGQNKVNSKLYVESVKFPGEMPPTPVAAIIRLSKTDTSVTLAGLASATLAADLTDSVLLVREGEALSNGIITAIDGYTIEIDASNVDIPAAYAGKLVSNRVSQSTGDITPEVVKEAAASKEKAATKPKDKTATKQTKTAPVPDPVEDLEPDDDDVTEEFQEEGEVFDDSEEEDSTDSEDGEDPGDADDEGEDGGLSAEERQEYISRIAKIKDREELLTIAEEFGERENMEEHETVKALRLAMIMLFTDEDDGE